MISIITKWWGYLNSWQDLRYVNGTFDDELEEVDVIEIRKLLHCDDSDGTDIDTRDP